MTDYPGVVPAPGFRISSRRLLALCGLNRFRFFNLEQSQVDLGLDGKTKKTGWVLDFSDGPETYWQLIKERDKDFVRKLAQRRKRLVESYGPLMFRIDPINILKELERLVAHKRQQYQSKGNRDPLRQRWTLDLL